MLKGAGLWFPPPFSYEYVIIGDLFSKCCGFHNSLHVCRNQAVKRPQSCGQTHPMTVAMKLMETLVKSAWEKCLTCWLDDNTYFESGWNLVAFEICLLFLCICKQQQVVFLDSHCEAADIYFKAFGNTFFSDPELAELGSRHCLTSRETACSPPQEFSLFWYSSWVPSLLYVQFSLFLVDLCKTRRQLRQVQSVICCSSCNLGAMHVLQRETSSCRLPVRLGNQILWAPEINLLSEVAAQLAERS